jgi:Flp pilus assembly protein TadG
VRQSFALIAALRRLRKDENGSIWIQAILVIVVIFGFTGLAIDAARYYMLNSDLQDIADAAALAGAKELNGAAGAINRATNAAQTYFNGHACPYSNGSPSTGNCARWWDTAGAAYASVNVYEKLSDIPGSPLDPADPAADAKASFIKVTTGSWSVVPTFLSAIGVTASQPTAAAATAGSTIVACNVQPLMLCNPNEPNAFNPAVGTLYGFTQQGGGGGFSPGDFSLLDPGGSTNSGATAIRNLLSQQSPNFCYVNSVSPRPGQAASSVADGINVRFDMQPSGNNQLDGLDQTPAPIVLKGIIPKVTGNEACNWTGGLPTQPPSYAAMPGDTDTALNSNGHMWEGHTMDVGTPSSPGVTPSGANGYWTYHYGTNLPSGITTRSQMYCRERGLALDCLTNPTDPPTAGQPAPTNIGDEKPAPFCSPNSPGSDRRRVISVAIVNCQDENAHGNNPPRVRSNTYAEFFLTKPVGSDGVIWAEFLRLMTPQSEGSDLHQVIRLYNK